MPRKTSSSIGPLSVFGTAKNFVSVMREMSFDEERRQAERMPRILVIAGDTVTGRKIGDELTGTSDSLSVSVWTLEASNRKVEDFDVVVIYNTESNDVYRRIRDRSGIAAIKVFHLASIEKNDWPIQLRQRIASAVPDRAPAFGRWFPVFRPAATKAVIDETARVNAQFALMSNLPAAIPIVGSLAAAGADFFVLTKNQVMMVFKLAAIHGRDLSDHWGIIREMGPVVGAGFLWRTLAREAADFLPFMLGSVPKIAIAYTGTVAAGRGAELYFRFGKKPTKEQMRSYYVQAADSFKKLPFPVIGHRETDVIEPIHEVK